MQDLINDSLRLLSKILSDTYEDFILIHLAQTGLTVFSYPTVPAIPTGYGYILDRTPGFLIKEGIIQVLSQDRFVIQDYKPEPLNIHMNTTRANYISLAEIIYKKFSGQSISFKNYSFYSPVNLRINAMSSRGLRFVVVDRKKADLWVKNKTIGQITTSPEQRSYWYEDKQLKFRLENGGIDQLDFTTADISRKIFEVFWDLWKDGAGIYSHSQIIERYKLLFKNNLASGKIGELVSNIRTSIIRPKPNISTRISWKFDHKLKVWIFTIK